MIYKGKKEIVYIYKAKKPVQALYKGKHLVWQAIRSCFGNGVWINTKPWIDDEVWKNN